jgi:hypothetical protein
MTKLARRMTVALALPLALGSLVAAPAQAAEAPTVTIVSSANPSVYGQPVTITATVVGMAWQPVTTGTVEFNVDGFTFGTVPVAANGTATSPPAVGEDGHPLDVTIGSDFRAVRAYYFPGPGESPYGEGSSNVIQQRVDRSASTLAIKLEPGALVADLSGTAPGGVQAGSLKPGGTVVFAIESQEVGTAPLNANGRASLPKKLAAGKVQHVAATYSGDSRYTGSTDSISRQDPTITATVWSKYPQTKTGWYRAPVDVSFSCRPHGARLVGTCPMKVRVKKGGLGVSVAGTIIAEDGGAATVVTVINLDRTKPEVRLAKGECKATDELSGVARCKLRRRGDELLAIAVDNAGNRTVLRSPLP